MASFQIVQAIGGKLLGAEIEEIGILMGSSLFKFNVGNLKISINCLPFGGYVKFADNFQFLPPLRKLLIVLIGLLPYFVLAVLCIGFLETFQKSATLYKQLILGAWSPIQVGAKYIEALAKIMTDNSFVVGLGILSAKMFAGNLIPLGTLNGGNAVLYLFEIFGFSSEKFSERFNLTGLLICLPFWIAWVFAIVVFCLKSLGIM